MTSWLPTSSRYMFKFGDLKYSWGFLGPCLDLAVEDRGEFQIYDILVTWTLVTDDPFEIHGCYVYNGAR